MGKGFGLWPVVRNLRSKQIVFSEPISFSVVIGTTFIAMSEQEEIRNKVAESGLVTFNLEDLYQLGNRSVFDLKDFLFEGLILREKDFRQALKEMDWSIYQDHYVAMTCTADAIVPQWAFMLVSTYIQPVAASCVLGDLEALETSLYQHAINSIDVSEYEDVRVIVKGCSKYPVPASAYVMLVNRLMPVTKSLMFGEACSTVPLHKR
jgi:hypothetical protein